VHRLKDGALAVHHDYEVCSADGKTAPLAQLTQADLKNFALKNPFADGKNYFIPLLEEILPVVLPKLDTLNIELKNDDNRYPDIEKGLLAVLSHSGFPLEKVLFSSFDLPTLLRLREACAQAQIGVLTRAFNVQEALNLRARSVHLNYKRFTPEIAQISHDNGLKVLLYTINDAALAQQVRSQGADGIFTDCIGQFIG
jgi:glycerophosphoryl diester phosphodiesterase